MSQAYNISSALDGVFFNSCGLDFGTSRSMIGYTDRGQHQIHIPHSFEDYRDQSGIPSLFRYTPDGGESVCSQVLDANGAEADPKGICRSVKTRLEEPEIILNGRSFSPAYIARRELQAIRDLCHSAICCTLKSEPSYQYIVAGVPMTFGDELQTKYRSIIREAFGGSPDVRLLPEPIAAALSYRESCDLRAGQKLLVFDMGAGTFDTALLLPNHQRTPEEPYPYLVRFPGGTLLAGDHFDGQMADLILRKLREQGSTLDPALLQSSSGADHPALKACAREAKEALSRSDTHICTIRFQGRTETVTVTRAEFEAVISDAVDLAVDRAWNVLRRAGLRHDPDVAVILAGGSSYIPLIRQRLAKRLSHIPSGHIFLHDPELAVVRGCTLFALETQCLTPPAYGYAIAAFQADWQAWGLNVVIPSGAKPPYYYSSTFRTRSRCSQVSIPIFEIEAAEEGERIRMDERITRMIPVTHKFDRIVPQNTPFTLSIDLSSSGSLTVTVDDGLQPEQTYSVRPADHRHVKRSSK